VTALAVGVLAALAVTFPLALNLRTAVLDDGSYDPYQFVWNLWWVHESLLRLHVNPFHTRFLFYPEGVSLLFHTFSFSLGVASLPLQAILPGGVLAAHNVLVLIAPALTFVLTALLAREITGDAWAALAAGVVATVNPIAVWFVPVLYLNCAYLIPALLLAWWRLQRTRRTRHLLLAVLLLVALVFASQDYATIALALLALDSVFRWLAPRALGEAGRWLAGTVTFWLAAAATLGTLAFVALGAPAAEPPAVQPLLGSGYLAGLVMPPWLSPPSVRFWTVLYLGTAAMLLVPVALLHRRSSVAYWTVAALATAAMALGPRIHLHHPAPDFRLPPGGLQVTGPPGPYVLATTLVPILRYFRAPYRWMVGTQVALAMVTALAVAGLRARVVPGVRRAAITGVLLAALVAAGLLDTRGLRAPLADARIPSVYRVLIDDPEPAAVLELPSGLPMNAVGAYSSLYMYRQTAHRKFLLEGTVARLPPGERPLILRNITDLAALPYVKYVVLHHELLGSAFPASRAQLERVEALARESGELVADDGGTAVYRLRTFRPASVL